MTQRISPFQQLEFNAKALSPIEVARSFVAPTMIFERLLNRNNSLLLGPRGSGKTTLLKMLTRKALTNWDTDNLQHYGSRVRFHSAFVAADRAWGAQLNAADSLTANRTCEAVARGEAAFAIHTILALAVAFRDAEENQAMPVALRHLDVVLDGEAEAGMVRALESALEIKAPIPSLLGLELGLRNALLRIDPLKTRASAPFWACASHLGEAISVAISIFSAFSKSQTEHWVILFDELEIAPRQIKDLLMQSLRGFDQRVAFKLALVPYLSDTPSLETRYSPQVGNDFEIIRLSYPHKQDARDFSRDLAVRLFSRLGVNAADLPRVLGPSIFQAGLARLSSYQRAENRTADPVQTVFKDLAAKDDSFSHYLNSKGIGGNNNSLGEADRASLVRKVLPSVILRDHYLREFRERPSGDQPLVSLRSRKSSVIYTGFPSLLEIADGNPRTLLYLLLPLVDELEARREHDAQAVLDAVLQSRAILRVTHTLVALVRTLPPSWPASNNPKGLMNFIDAIGYSLQARLLRGPFEPDYVGSFTVHSNAPDALVAAVGDAVNAGALVHLPDEEGLGDSALTGLRGRRFRLSYTLAPRYRLALTAGQPVSLASLLSGRPSATFEDTQSSFELGTA